MIDFFTDLIKYRFLQYALLTGILVSVSCGITGTFVTVRRISSMAGAIAHASLGGMGMALYLNREAGMTFFSPLLGAVIFALLSAIIISLLTIYGKQREDTIIGAVWAVGMAIGVFFISRTSGYQEDLMSYLFGNILMVSGKDLIFTAALDVLTAAVSVFFFNKLSAVCFDEEFSRLRGINTAVYYTLLLCITALTVVMLIQVVGIVMVIALLTLPAAAASRFSSRLGTMIIYSILLSMLCTTGGLIISYGPDLPSGATIIILAGILYIFAFFASGYFKKLRQKRKNSRVT
ncbi:MAG: metal ABC transporter permease [Fibrobacterota bacterium]